MMETDPTEAADSARILGAVRTMFPDAEVIPTGWIIYHMALDDILSSFDEHLDAPLLQSLLLLNEILAVNGQTHYAVALAVKR